MTRTPTWTQTAWKDPRRARWQLWFCSIFICTAWLKSGAPVTTMDFALRTVVIISSIDKEVTKCEPSQFIGKVSPQFFWGSFDLAVSRFSGRPAPMHPGAPYVARSVMVEAYSHEVSSCGFWPCANGGIPATLRCNLYRRFSWWCLNGFPAKQLWSSGNLW